MTLRERIADWISGGAFFVYKNQASVHHERMEWFAREMDEANARLDRIAAQESPGANATVRRMARIARGEE